MNRKTTIASLMLCTVSASAQITIGGHQPFYDMATKSMLFVASQASLSDLTATVDTVAGNKWTDIKIDGNAITGKIAFCFGNVSEDRTFVLSATENDSSIVPLGSQVCQSCILSRKTHLQTIMKRHRLLSTPLTL